MFHTVRARITSLTVVIVVCLYALSSLAVYGIIQRVVSQDIDRQTVATARTLTTGDPAAAIKGLAPGTYAWTNANGRVVTNAPSRVAARLAVLAASRRSLRFTLQGSDGQALRVLVLHGPQRVVVVAVNVQREFNVLARLRRVLWEVGLFAALAAALGGFYLAGRALRPIRQAWRRQLEFVADASHELRTPLAVIQSNLNVVLEHSDQTVADNLEWIDNAYSETRRMNKLVQDLLTLARGDAEAMVIRKTPVDLAALVQRVAELFDPVAREKNLTLVADNSPAVEIRADADRIHQLLVILVDNAVKYTPEGGRIELRLARKRHMAAIEVRDSGIGIPKEHLNKVFERFYQVEGSRTAGNARGAGLGLAIAKWIVTVHGGRIAVASIPGRGTTFTVSLPVH